MNAVLTIAIGNEYQAIAKYTHPTLKKYAEKIGADFLVIDKQKISQTTPHWEKFQISELLNKYERIIYLDTDIIVREDCPNLFEIVPKEKLGMFNEAPFTDRSKELMIDICRQYGKTLPYWNGKYYNSGVMVISRKHKFLFEKPEKEIFSFYEQSYLNMCIAEREVEMFDLDYKFNRMTCMDRFIGIHRLDSYIVHYAGYPSLTFVLDLIRSDLERWKKDSPHYKYKQNIHISVSGGLGDQLEAEPSIRFMKEKVLPEAEISISCHWPRIFEHLKELGIKVYQHGEFVPEPDTPYRLMESFPDTKSIYYAIVSNLMCHTADYCSIALLKRILPLEAKRIKLTYSLKDLSKVYDIMGICDLTKFVVVHPGRHWESKTFPVEYWQEIIDGIHKEGLPLCIIGKDEPGDPPTYIPGARGTVDVKCPKGAFDLRNLLDLGGLIALLSQAKILLSNDSAPIHLAGAFDNWIVVIPTCKHPDHILPYRNGSPWYKSLALYKKLVLDDLPTSPTEVKEVSAANIVDKWENYLPESKEVVDKVKEIYYLN